MRYEVNGLSKRLQPIFYNDKLENLASSNPKKWWRNLRDIIGIARSEPSQVFTGLVQEINNGDIEGLANEINECLHSIYENFLLSCKIFHI